MLAGSMRDIIIRRVARSRCAYAVAYDGLLLAEPDDLRADDDAGRGGMRRRDLLARLRLSG